MSTVTESINANVESQWTPVSADSIDGRGIDAEIRGGDKIMLWLLIGFFVLLGTIVVSELIFKSILGLQI